MSEFRRLEGRLQRRVIELRTKLNLSQEELANDMAARGVPVSLATIKSIEAGSHNGKLQTRIKRNLAEYFGVDPTMFIAEHSRENYHIIRRNPDKLAELVERFGPSVRQALPIGTFTTTWLQYDTCDGDRYLPEHIFGTVSDEFVSVPAEFQTVKNKVVHQNQEDKEANRKYWYNGPTLCLSHIDMSNTDGDDEKSILRLSFKGSEYANNKVAKSHHGYSMLIKALQEFEFLGQPIEHFSSGIGIALLLYCENGKTAIFSRRSVHEEFRSRDCDVSVVEAIHPKKDRVTGTHTIDIYGAAKRGLMEELGLDVQSDQICLTGFGVDLEYYQWNVIGHATVDRDASEILQHWHTAEDRKESEDLFAIEATPEALFTFCRDHAIWGSGLAAVYNSLVKRFGAEKIVRVANAVFTDVTG